MALFDGLMILGLISSAKQLIKEAMEPTLPANARIDWVKIYEDEHNGMSQEEYAKRMARGYYHTTEPMKYFDLMAYRQDVLDGATPDELEQNRKNLKYNYVKPAGYSIYQNWKLWDGYPSDLIIDVERYEYERRKNPEYFESLGYIPRGDNYFNFTDERLWRLEKRSLESWFEGEKYMFLNYMNWGDIDGAFELNSDPHNYEVSAYKKNQSSGKTYEFMVGFSADKIEYFQVNHMYTLSKLLRDYFWKMEWIYGNMESFLKECSPWEKYSDISLTLEERENEKTFVIVEGKIYRSGYYFYMRGKVGPLSAKTESVIRDNFHIPQIVIPLGKAIGPSARINVFEGDCNQILKEHGFTNILVIQSGLSIQVKANKNSCQYGMYLGCSGRNGVQYLQSLFKDCTVSLCKAEESLLGVSFWDKLEQLGEYQVDEYPQEKYISDFEMSPKLAGEISYMGSSYDLRIGWVTLDPCTDMPQEVFSQEESAIPLVPGESVFRRHCKTALNEHGFSNLVLCENDDSIMLTVYKQNQKYGLYLDCEADRAKYRLNPIFKDCLNVLLSLKAENVQNEFEKKLNKMGKYDIKLNSSGQKLDGFDVCSCVSLRIKYYGNSYGLILNVEKSQTQNESAFYKTYDAMLSECGFQNITLQEEKTVIY